MLLRILIVVCPKGSDPLQYSTSTSSSTNNNNTSNIGYQTLQITTQFNGVSIDTNYPLSNYYNTINTDYIRIIIQGINFFLPAIFQQSIPPPLCNKYFENSNLLFNIVNCSVILNSNNNIGYIYTITFISYNSITYENNIYTNNGVIPLSQIFCDTSEVRSELLPFCSVSDITPVDTVIPGKMYIHAYIHAYIYNIIK